MKLFTLLFFILSVHLPAASRPHLVCLGQEEVNIHKIKDTGPYYRLNQEMISNMLQLSESVQLKNQFLKQVCESKSPSFELLKLIFTNNKSIFKSFSTDVQRKSVDNDSIKELKNRSFKVLLNFLTRKQATYTDPNCLKRKVPEVLSFYENATYLLSEIGIENTIKTIRNKDIFFNKLDQLPKNRNCQ